MHYIPKKTLSLIIDSGNDYLVAVKGNQKKLYRQVQSIVAHRKIQQPSFTVQQQQHGRQEQRRVSVFSAAGIDHKQWPAVKTILCVERQRSCQGKCSSQRAYYISSLKTTAQSWMGEVRGHWSIENRLHWPKDVVLKEDDTYGREANALLNASLFRSITINLLRLNGFNSIASGLRQLANQVQQIFLLLQ